MSENKYYKSFDEFLADHPEINPEWKGFMEPVIQSEEQGLFNFILTYIFM